MWSRRRVVLAGVGGLAAAALGVGVWAPLRGPAPGRACLSREEEAVVRAAGAALFPAGSLPVDGGDERVVAEVDRVLADCLAPGPRAGLRYLLRALQVGTLASRGVLFSQASGEVALAVLREWSDPSVVPRRVAYDSLRAVLAMAYFGLPESRRAIGWAPGCSLVNG